MRSLWLTIVAMLYLPQLASAHPLYLSGTIGSAPVLLMIERNDEALSGWYVYLRQGKQIRLEGKAAADGAFTLDEFSGPASQKTGAFDGRIDGGKWNGSWRKPEQQTSLPLRLTESADALSGLSGRFTCATKKVDRAFGYTYRHSLKLQVSRGAVNALDIVRGETGTHGEDQACIIALADVKQEKSDAGILLRTRGSATATGPRCTIRVIGAGDYLYVQMGDWTESGNDCRGDDAAMYCSPRSFWADMIVNRKTRACVSVE
ncbi:MAG TPA: hypothetical protein VNR39_13235 [Pseudolabrys sp.]|nr:hypothetical protein [Pseudolabrys sp.]